MINIYQNNEKELIKLLRDNIGLLEIKKTMASSAAFIIASVVLDVMLKDD